VIARPVASAAKCTYLSVVRWLSYPGRARRLFLAYCVAMLLAFAILIPPVAMEGFPVWGPGDFTAFYTAGYIVRTGNAHHLYDLDLQTRVQQQFLLPHGWTFDGGLLPYANPPFFALLFVPLSLLPLLWAFHLWNLINLSLLFGSLGLLLFHRQEWSAKEFGTVTLVTLACLSFKGYQTDRAASCCCLRSRWSTWP